MKTAQLIEETAPNDENVFVRLRSFISGSKRKGDADLRPEQVQARVRIGLSAIGKMLIKDAAVDLQAIVQPNNRNARRPRR